MYEDFSMKYHMGYAVGVEGTWYDAKNYICFVKKSVLREFMFIEPSLNFCPKVNAMMTFIKSMYNICFFSIT